MTIKVLAASGIKEIKAFPTKLPGLAYHRAVAEKGWTITHVKSGYSVISGIKTRDNLKRALAALAELPIDWTMSRTALRRANKLHVTRIRQIAREVT